MEKTKEEIINFNVGLKGYPHLLSLLTRMDSGEKREFIIDCMAQYADQQTQSLQEENNELKDVNKSLQNHVNSLIKGRKQLAKEIAYLKSQLYKTNNKKKQ